jgi:PIN domain nuclease of toxin-antitoxin system
VASLTHVDSHVLVWLYLPRLDLLSPRARRVIDAGDVGASPMAVLELTYLAEIGRLTVDGPTIFASLGQQLGLVLDETGFARVVEEAHVQRWTHDPFDRIIAAHAVAAGAPLLTADAVMRRHVPGSVW